MSTQVRKVVYCRYFFLSPCRDELAACLKVCEWNCTQKTSLSLSLSCTQTCTLLSQVGKHLWQCQVENHLMKLGFLIRFPTRVHILVLFFKEYASKTFIIYVRGEEGKPNPTRCSRWKCGICDDITYHGCSHQPQFYFPHINVALTRTYKNNEIDLDTCRCIIFPSNTGYDILRLKKIILSKSGLECLKQTF